MKLLESPEDGKTLSVPILAVRKASHVNIKTKMFDIEANVLIGWLANNLREPGNQNACLKIKHFCFYVKVACFSYGEYIVTDKYMKVSGKSFSGYK